MTTPNLQGFVQQTAHLASQDHVRLTTTATGDKAATQARNNFGTKAAEWFRDKLSVKDPATKAFKAAVRAEVTPAQARKIFRDAGIHASKPLTRGQIKQASTAVGRVLHPRNKTKALMSLKVASQVPQPQTKTATATQTTIAQTPTAKVQTSQPGIDAFDESPLAQDCWQKYEATTASQKNERIAYLKGMAQSLPDPLSNIQRDALKNIVAGKFNDVAATVSYIQEDTKGARKDWSMGAMLPFVDVIVELCPTHDPILLEFAKDWLVQARGDREPGTRLSAEREKLTELNKAFTNATNDQERQTALDGFKALGGKMIAAVFEQAIRSSGPYDGKTAVFGEVSFDRNIHGDVAALLENFGDVPMQTGLPELKGAFLPIFEQATVDFAKTYGSGAGVAALIALKKAGADPAALQALKNQIASTISDRSSMQKLALHGSTTDPRIVDPTAAFCRALVLELGGDVEFDQLKTETGTPIKPPELEPKVDTKTIETATQLSDVLGKDFKPIATDGSQYQANGRTLRFTAEDGRVIALKFMRNNETPGKLQREHESFGLMQSALGDKFAASPRKLGAQEDQAMIRIPEDMIPKEALDKLNGELKSGGLTAFKENGSYLVMSYEVNAEVGDKFFNYLESSKDDKSFKQGFTDSMSALGKMASHGYFNPNLIQNAYHAPAKGDADNARGWIWSMNLLKPGRDNTGKEDQQLANAKWSNFREGGLADPDEFRHLDNLKSAELGKLLGDKVMASELQESKQSFESLLPTYLIGRMFHESLVIATRRMVDEGAFASGTSPDRQRELVDTFKSGLKEGIEAFAREFTGKDGKTLAEALQKNGLDLDKAIDKVAQERASMFSFEYAGKMRSKDADYFGQLFSIDKDIIEFDPPASNAMRDNGDLVPLDTILKSDDPLAMFNKTQQPGFTTVLITDKDGTIKHALDLGWMTNNLDQHEDIFTADKDGVAKFELRKTAHDGKLAIIEAGPNFDPDKYLAGTKARAHQYQNIGGYNATYFFQNEQHLNHVLSATLVELRAS